MLRFGMNFIIPKEYSDVVWYGRGPHETRENPQHLWGFMVVR